MSGEVPEVSKSERNDAGDAVGSCSATSPESSRFPPLDRSPAGGTKGGWIVGQVVHLGHTVGFGG